MKKRLAIKPLHRRIRMGVYCFQYGVLKTIHADGVMAMAVSRLDWGIAGRGSIYSRKFAERLQATLSSPYH